MAKREAFLLRIDPRVLTEVRRWADDELRSVNAQIEFILKQSLRQAGRISKSSHDEDSASESGSRASSEQHDKQNDAGKMSGNRPGDNEGGCVD